METHESNSKTPVPSDNGSSIKSSAPPDKDVLNNKSAPETRGQNEEQESGDIPAANTKSVEEKTLAQVESELDISQQQEKEERHQKPEDDDRPL